MTCLVDSVDSVTGTANVQLSAWGGQLWVGLLGITLLSLFWFAGFFLGFVEWFGYYRNGKSKAEKRLCRSY